MTRNHHSDDIS
ncbi:unnamed protein product, partial [Allacma fusca]